MPLTVLCQLLHLHWVEDILITLGIFYNLTVIWGHKKEVLCGLKFQPQMCFKSDLSDLLTLPGHGIGWAVICSLVLPSTQQLELGGRVVFNASRLLQR